MLVSRAVYQNESLDFYGRMCLVTETAFNVHMEDPCQFDVLSSSSGISDVAEMTELRLKRY